MIQYPSTPFVYEVLVLALSPSKEYVFVRLSLPTGKSKVVYIRRSERSKYEAFKAGKECFRDIAYYVFGEDWRWFEASMSKRDRNRMWFAIGRKIWEEVEPLLESTRA